MAFEIILKQSIELKTHLKVKIQSRDLCENNRHRPSYKFGFLGPEIVAFSLVDL